MKSGHVRTVATVLALACTLAMFFFPLPRQNGQDKKDIGDMRVSHAWGGMVVTVPFVVDGDADFAVHGATGRGRPLDPWVFENLLVECDFLSAGIIIMNTDDHFVIRNCYINESYDGVFDGLGIGIQATDNGDIINCTIEAFTGGGIFMYDSSDMTVVNCTILDAYPSASTYAIISGWDTVNTLIDNNTIINCSKQGIGFQRFLTPKCLNLNITRNTIINITTGSSIDNANVDGMRITDNYLYNSTVNLIGLDDCRNFTIDGNLMIQNHFIGMELRTCQIFSVSNNVVRENVWDENFYLNDCDQFNLTGNDILTGSSWIGNIGLAANCTNGIVRDNLIDPRLCTIDDKSYLSLYVGTGENISVINNTFYNDPQWPHMYIQGINKDITNNTLIDGDTGISFAVGCDDINVTGNRLFSIDIGISFTANIDATITGNYFTNISVLLATAALTGQQIWDSNYYHEYFEVFPYALTANTSTNVLQYVWAVNATLNDTRPRYDALFYPRNQMIFLNFYSNVDGLGITFGNLHVLLNGVPLTVTYPVIPSVLYNLSVSDYKGRLLYLAILNLNSSGMYVDIGLDVAVQVFFHFYSTIDYFGLDPNWIVLYVDGVRYTRLDPIMELKVINVVVKDYAGSTVYNQNLNLSLTGVFLDIGLAIAPIIVKNNFGQTMRFVLEKGATLITYTMPQQSEIILRLGLGTYIYSVFYLNGTEYRTSAITFTAGSDNAISFGFVTTTPITITDTETQLIEIAVLGVVVGAVLGSMSALSRFISPKRGKQRKRDH